MLIESKSEPTLAADLWTLYLYAMRSPATKEKYQGTLDNKASFFAHKGKYDSVCVCSILEFLQTQKVLGDNP